MVKIDKYEVPNELYDAYVSWYVSWYVTFLESEFESPAICTTANKEMMKIHEKICEIIGIPHTEDENDPFYHDFLMHIRADAGVGSFDLLNEYKKGGIFLNITENKIEKFRKFNPKFLDWFFSTQSSEEYKKSMDDRIHRIANQREFNKRLSQKIKEDPPKYEQYLKKRNELAKKYYHKNREKILLQKRKERKERKRE